MAYLKLPLRLIFSSNCSEFCSTGMLQKPFPCSRELFLRVSYFYTTTELLERFSVFGFSVVPCLFHTRTVAGTVVHQQCRQKEKWDFLFEMLPLLKSRDLAWPGKGDNICKIQFAKITHLLISGHLLWEQGLILGALETFAFWTDLFWCVQGF